MSQEPDDSIRAASALGASRRKLPPTASAGLGAKIRKAAQRRRRVVEVEVVARTAASRPVALFANRDLV